MDKFRQLSWPVSIYRYHQGLKQIRAGEWCSIEDVKKVNHKVSVCILDKEHYVETTKRYPIRNLAHLYQVVRAESKTISPYNSNSLWAITGKDTTLKTYTVTFWSLKSLPSVVSNNFRWIIPESLLLKVALEPNVAYRVESDRARFFYSDAYLGTKVIFEDSLVPTVKRFTELVQTQNTVATLDLSNDEYQDILLKSASKLPLTLLPGLYLANSKKQELAIEEYKWPCILFAALLSFYAVGTSYYQSHMIERLSSEVAEKQSSAFKVIENEELALSNMSRWKKYLELKHEYPGIIKIYSAILIPLSETEAELSNFQIQGNAVTLYGTAPSATKFFERVASVNDFTDVKLDGNITVDRRSKRERFIIKLTFRGENNES